MNVPQMDFSTYPSQVFWLLLCVLFLFFFIKNVFLPRITAILEARDRRIQGDKERALEARARAKQLKQDYEEKILENRMEVRHQVEKGLQELRQVREERFSELQKEFIERCTSLEKKKFFEVSVEQDFVSILLRKKNKEDKSI